LIELFSTVYPVTGALLLTVCLTKNASKVATVKLKLFCLSWQIQAKLRQGNDVSARWKWEWAPGRKVCLLHKHEEIDPTTCYSV